MEEIAFIERSKRVDARDLAFFTRACNIQMIEHFAPAWAIEPWPCVAYKDVPEGGTAYPIALLDEVGEPGLDGFHNPVFGRVMVNAGTPVTMSHEAVEARLDPGCNLWVPMPGDEGLETAKEAADAVEADVYFVEVELFGERRQIPVSNFLLPSWFDPAGAAPFDYMGKLSAPFTMTPGGYMMVRDASGRVSAVFARDASADRRAAVGHKFADPLSRTYRRLHG